MIIWSIWQNHENRLLNVKFQSHSFSILFWPIFEILRNVNIFRHWRPLFIIILPLLLLVQYTVHNYREFAVCYGCSDMPVQHEKQHLSFKQAGFLHHWDPQHSSGCPLYCTYMPAFHHNLPTSKVSTSDLLYFWKHHLMEKNEKNTTK